MLSTSSVDRSAPRLGGIMDCMPLQDGALSNDNLDEVTTFIRRSNPFAQKTWGWDTGRFMDWRYGFNTARNIETPRVAR
jgi:hypothetical protein